MRGCLNEWDGCSREGTSQTFMLCVSSWAGDLGQTTLPFTNKIGTKLPLSLLFCCFIAHEGRKEKNAFVWSIHPPFRSWNPHPCVMTWPHCYIPGTADLGEQGAPGCCCMSDRVGRQTKMDLKLLLLAQEGKKFKQMGNRMSNGASTINGNSSCNRVSLEASCRVVMYFILCNDHC